MLSSRKKSTNSSERSSKAGGGRNVGSDDQGPRCIKKELWPTKGTGSDSHVEVKAIGGHGGGGMRKGRKSFSEWEENESPCTRTRKEIQVALRQRKEKEDEKRGEQ